MNAATLTTVADALADTSVPSLRFNFPYRAAGSRAPDRPAALEAAVREAVDGCPAHQAPARAPRMGGRSMGGRICSMVAADSDGDEGGLGLVLLGYPLTHRAGRNSCASSTSHRCAYPQFSSAGPATPSQPRPSCDVKPRNWRYGLVPLGRDGRSRLQTVEGERVDGRRRARRRGRRRHPFRYRTFEHEVRDS